MGGWKTWGGAILVGVAAAGKLLFPEYAEYFDLMLKFGAMLGLVGIGHKIEKAGK